MGKDVVALGELLVDFISEGTSPQGNPLFEANPGGAPCNVLALLSKHGRDAAFIGKVGNDFLGGMLAEKAAAQGIDMQGLFRDPAIPTTLAFVHKKENGDRDFSFYRDPGADVMLSAAEVESCRELIASSKIFHFGTLSMNRKECFEATRLAVEIAKTAGVVCSFDPNYREPLWNSTEEALAAIRYGLSVCDVLKISDNEVELVSGTADIDEGIGRIVSEFKIPLVFATLGPDGSRAYYKGERAAVHPGFKNPDTIETTGAGDTFCGSALSFVLKYGLEGLDEDKLAETLEFANAAASIITTRKGALAVMPSLSEVEEFLAVRKRK
ncbi:MAG: carbohydrate kinase [Lachnospiraceae bacterium]|nr:carbohydrate kinase [Lachnospiraceae bacterium]